MFYPSIPFNKYMKMFKKAFTSGIDIYKLNNLRKKYSIVKNGRLARMTKARIISLIFSDVPGDDLSTVASGPTYGAKNAENILLLTNMKALEEMEKMAKIMGLKSLIVTNRMKGEARETGKRIVKSLDKFPQYNCLIYGGETTVTMKGRGTGGRNQELCMGALEEISKRKAVLVSIDTDGIDGSSDAAGAIVDNETLKLSLAKNLDYARYLKNNDSYHFFKKLNALIYTGQTGTNVSDIAVIIKS